MISITTHVPSILVVNDDSEIRTVICRLLRREGFKPTEAATGDTAIRRMKRCSSDVVLLEVNMPDVDSITIMREIRKFNNTTPFIVLAGCVGAAAEAMKSGAFQYLTKPLNTQETVLAIRSALGQRQNCLLDAAGSAAPDARQPSLREMMGSGDLVCRLIEEINRVAPTDFTVIVTGETGSGKELVAREIHRQSRRSKGPFVAIDCGAIQPSLIESELFGHEKGAFTGADRSRVGKFEAASEGTLFLDEVQNLPLGVQTNLLRALQERQVCPLGGSRHVNVDIRVITATNQDLPALVPGGQFRQDLYHRINEFSIEVPALRERPDDILYLVRRFAQLTYEELGKGPQKISLEALEALQNYSWPGNVRELRNLIRRAVLVADAEILTEHLGPAGLAPCTCRKRVREEGVTGSLSLKAQVRRVVIDAEREILTRMLKRTGGNKAEAARLLQVDYKTLRTKTKQYGLTHLLNGSSEDTLVEESFPPIGEQSHVKKALNNA